MDSKFDCCHLLFVICWCSSAVRLFMYRSNQSMSDGEINLSGNFCTMEKSMSSDLLCMLEIKVLKGLFVFDTELIYNTYFLCNVTMKV